MRIQNIFIISMISFLAMSCSVVAVKDYAPNLKSNKILEKADIKVNEVRVNAASPRAEDILAKTSLQCRARTFNMPANKNVRSYIADAFKEELLAANKFVTAGAPIVISLVDLESSTLSVNKGSWNLELAYNLNGNTKKIKTTTEFESAFYGETACLNVSAAFEEAVRANFMNYFKALEKK